MGDGKLKLLGELMEFLLMRQGEEAGKRHAPKKPMVMEELEIKGSPEPELSEEDLMALMNDSDDVQR